MSNELAALRRVAFLASLLCLAVLPVTAAARPNPAASACITAFNKAQDARVAGKLLEARKGLVHCGLASCPANVRKACLQIAAKVDAEIPTVVVAVLDVHGNDIASADLFVDDEKRNDLEGGSPQPLDPGRHVLEAKLSDGTSAEQVVVLRSGDKERRVELRFKAKPSVAHDSQVAAQTGEPRNGSWKKPAGYTLIGLGVVGLSAGIYFGLKGLSQGKKYESCATCSDAELNDLKSSRKRNYLLADIGYGTAILGAALGTYFLFTAPGSSKEKAASVSHGVGFGFNSRGASAWLHGSF